MCTTEGATKDCYGGPMTEIGQGECRAGVLTCSNGVWSRCEGEQLAEPESCNGLDDNCDGRVDNAEVKCPETCDMSGRELCNDVDDDCDGETDENADQPCYTATTGCKRRPDGVDFMCAGLCAKGVRRCVDGKLEEPCIGQVGPRDEVCDSGGTALDEDCDGQTNEDCRCIGSQTQACYGGEMGTAMVGVCRMGRQVCAGSAFGECVGEQQPSEETCLNPGADDDCDGTPDDVPSLGIPCVPTEPGRAQCRGRLACVEGQRGPNPSCVPDTGAEVCGGYDEDCDGNIDEACPRGQGCCGTACVNLDEDRNNCGACRTRCDAGESCVDGDCRRNVAGEGGGGGGGMGGMSGTGGMGGGGMSGSGGQGGAAGEAGGGGAGGS